MLSSLSKLRLIFTNGEAQSSVDCPGSSKMFLKNWHQDDRSRGGVRVLIIHLNSMESGEMRRNWRPSRCAAWSHQRNGQKEGGSLSFS
jgi:hypothetical protein